MQRKITNVWLTLNRACNLRCIWCYASKTEYNTNDQMSYDKILDIIQLIKDINVNHVTLLGGEPTMHKDLIPIIKLLKSKGINSTLITNGLKLADKSYLNQLEHSGLNSISVSLKGYSVDNFEAVTGYNGYERIMEAIKSLSNTNMHFSVSYVLSDENIDYFLKAIEDCKRHGAPSFSFSLCYDFSNMYGSKQEYNISKKVFYVIEKFMHQYEELNAITEGRFSLSQMFPLCAWDSEFIKRMEEQNQVRSVCQLLRQCGLIFDTDLNVIPCNAMHDMKIGKYGEDFSTGDELKAFWNSDSIISIYNKLKAVPNLDCLKCENISKCGGGCLSNWFNFTYDDLLKEKDKRLV